ncbi:uncharacterized protein LOC119590472 [Penaeus monodon]|uniref:uncharacterized protein LOC119590472 n=1 Tax=Penaeus monodon TaxID=6687 RepID=UPI0018A7A359|nr:uncharacterized protein LOC119590472 [Penaeus monodon]
MSLEHVRIPFPPSPTLLTVGSTTLQDPRPPDTLLQELRTQLSAFTSQHLRESVNASRALQELLSGRAGLDAEVGRMGGAARALEGHRGRRQIVTPDLGALQSGYTSFFGGNNRRHHTSSRGTTSTGNDTQRHAKAKATTATTDSGDHGDGHNEPPHGDCRSPRRR